ncbi:MAG: serine/threonine protein kinase [Blautia sp.]|nr:serine/threonine protein kinase [Lachnoclostridium sp.]MCM1210957.1 serine/threonine protein kinase [Blautia sp.]
MEKVLAGKYELQRRIGEGSGGIVYLAWDRHLERLVAVKSQKLPENPADCDMLRREMEMLKTLKHPMLPAVYDFFVEEAPYLVMEYIQGMNLYQLIEKEGAIAEEQACEWALQLIDLFSYLHSHKPPVIYRDLKPRNMMVCPDGKLRVVDLGTAFFFRYSEKRMADMAGTVGYAAPEQLGDAENTMAKADERSDIYTFGATLYHMLTGFDPSLPPYGIRPVRTMNPALTAGIEWIVKRCTQVEPSKRYQSMEEVKADLARRTYLGRRHSIGGFGRKNRYVLKKLEKKIWLTDKKTVGLLAIVLLLGGMVFGRQPVHIYHMEAPLPVIVYNTQGQKMIIRYDSVYTPEGNLILELDEELFAKENIQELSVSLTDCLTGERQERIFYVMGK